MIGGLTPAALSVGFGLWGALSPRNPINRGRFVPDEINFGRRGRVVPNEINFGRAGRIVPNEINFGRPGNGVPWLYGETQGALGTTDMFGNITIRPGLTGRELGETIAHEAVHRFFSAKSGPLLNFRARAGIWGYENSHLLKFLEEAMAETVATGSLWKGLIFPLQGGYGVSAARILAEAAGYTIFVGGAAYGAYWWSSD